MDTVIERMDDYFLNREDWDTLIELGLDDYKDELVLKKISTATKTALTRKYVHFPLRFYRADVHGVWCVLDIIPRTTLLPSIRRQIWAR